MTGLFLFAFNTGFAQEAATESTSGYLSTENILWVVLVISVILLVALVSLLYSTVRYLTRMAASQVLREVGVDLEKKLKEKEAEKQTSWQEFKQAMTEAVPVEEEEDILMDHEYDGIRELDNKLPPWWVGMFYASIIFSVVYMAYYHVFGGPSSEEEYQMMMAEAAASIEAYKKANPTLINEDNVEALTNVYDIADGKKTFLSVCQACHGAEGGGKEGLGPNLTDEYWIHGGSIKDIFSTISNGVPAKNMPPWKEQLSPKQIQQVASYVLTLQGTNPPGAKAPEGELYDPGAEEGKEKHDAVTEGDTTVTAQTAK